MKSATGLVLIIFVLALAYVSKTEGEVICWSGSGFVGCDAGCNSKPGFSGGICRTGWLGYQYCSCYSEADGSLVPICTGPGGYQACKKGCEVNGNYDAVCETQINFCNCIRKAES